MVDCLRALYDHVLKSRSPSHQKSGCYVLDAVVGVNLPSASPISIHHVLSVMRSITDTQSEQRIVQSRRREEKMFFGHLGNTQCYIGII